MGGLIDLTGKVFGRLKVIKRDYTRKRNPKIVWWGCECSCGNTSSVRGYCLRSGETKSCGCIQHEILIDRNFKHGKSDAPEYKMFWAARHRAKQNKLEFNLAIEDIVIPKKCPVLGIKLKCYRGLKAEPKRVSYNSPVLDRLNNDEGYIKNNINVISARANRIKTDATIAEIEAVLKYMKGENLKNG